MGFGAGRLRLIRSTNMRTSLSVIVGATTAIARDMVPGLAGSWDSVAR
jgi:hypothetical protein